MKVKSVLRAFCSCVALACVAFAAISCGSGSGGDAATDAQQTAVDKQAAAASIAQADKLYAQREDIARVRQGVIQLRQARAADPQNYDAAWRLAMFNYYLGAHTKDDKERDKAFRDGVEAGKAAVKLQDGKPEGHFWLGANYGGIAQTSTLGGLSALEDIRKEMQTVLRLDEGYQSGSAYMVLGQVDLEAPKMLGGDAKRAVEQLEKGLRFGDTNPLLRLTLAQAYIQVKRTEDARKQLNAILSMKPNPDYLPEYKEAAAEAKKILDNGMKVE